MEQAIRSGVRLTDRPRPAKNYLNNDKGIWSWMSTIDHKRIGLMYLVGTLGAFFLAGMFASYPMLVYTAFDLSVGLLWTYVSISCILSHLPRAGVEAVAGADPSMRKYGEDARPTGAYYYRPR